MQGLFSILLFVMVWTQTGASPTVTLDPEEEDPLSKCYSDRIVCEYGKKDPSPTPESESDKNDTF